MLVTDAKLTNVQQIGSSVVVAEAAERTSILQPGELIVLVEGVHTEIELVKELYPTARRGKSSNRHGRSEFNTFESYDEMLEMFQKRPGELVKYDPHELDVRDFNEKGNELQYELTGDFIDIGRVLEGVPESFGSMHSGKMRNRRVRIVLNASQVVDMPESAINKRSERVIRLINALEAHNFPVELIAIDSCTCYHVENVVKRFNEPLVLEDVAIVSHSEYLRRLHFRVSEYSKTWYDGYGSPSTLRGHIDEFRSLYNDELTIYIGNDMASYDIDNTFDELERVTTEELSQEIPSLALIKAEPNNVTVLNL